MIELTEYEKSLILVLITKRKEEHMSRSHRNEPKIDGDSDQLLEAYYSLKDKLNTDSSEFDKSY